MESNHVILPKFKNAFIQQTQILFLATKRPFQSTHIINPQKLKKKLAYYLCTTHDFKATHHQHPHHDVCVYITSQRPMAVCEDACVELCVVCVCSGVYEEKHDGIWKQRCDGLVGVILNGNSR